MTTFEILSSMMLGLGAGFAVTVFARRRSIGVTGTLLLGALGGFVAAGLGHEALARWPWPTWGSLGYHPMDGVLAVIGGILAVSIGRLVLRRSTNRRASNTAT